jgi:hypothetical protein
MAALAARASATDRCARLAGSAGRGDRKRADAAVARQGLRAAGGAQARNVPRNGPVRWAAEAALPRVSAILTRRLSGAAPPGPGALRAPLKTLEIFITGSGRHTVSSVG